MEALFKNLYNLLNDKFSGNICINYDSFDNREIVNVRLYETTPNEVLELRKLILHSNFGVDCFNYGDIRLENDFEWEGNDKTYPLVHLDLYLCEEMLDYYEGVLKYFNGKVMIR